jgi:transposase-like protein
MNACVQILPQSIPSVVRVKKQGTVHILTQNIKGNYTCHYCDFNSLKKTTVSEHISRIHPKEAGRQINPFKCKYCDKKFQNELNEKAKL